MLGTVQQETLFIRWWGRKVCEMCELLLYYWRCSERHKALRDTLLCLQCCQWQSSVALLVKRSCCLFFFFFRSHLLLLIYVASVQQLPPQTVLPILPFFPHTDLLIKAIIYGQYVNPACTPSQFPLGETHLKRMFLRAKIYRNVVDLVLWCVVFQHISITKCKMKQDLPRKNWVWLFWAHFLFFLFFLQVA